MYLKSCICLKSENVNIENEGAVGKNVLPFWNLSFQNEKMDGEWTDLPPQNITPPPRTTHSLKSKIFDLPPKKQNSNSPLLNLAGGAHYDDL